MYVSIVLFIPNIVKHLLHVCLRHQLVFLSQVLEILCSALICSEEEEDNFIMNCYVWIWAVVFMNMISV